MHEHDGSDRSTRAIVRRPSPKVSSGEVTHIERSPLDPDLAYSQHEAYLRLLEAHGVTLIFAPDAPEHPDGVFVEDALVVIGSTAVLTRPGALSRRGEPDTLVETLATIGIKPERLTDPATLDGGDVLVARNHVFVGETTRTNQAGHAQLREVSERHGLPLIGVQVPGFLHLKSAITSLPDGSLIGVPGAVDFSTFESLGYQVHSAGEPSGGDVLCLGKTVVLPSDATLTAQTIRALGFPVELVDVSELQKIEAGVTCMSVFLPG